MERQKTVLDASVAVKWFVSEPLSEKAEKILEEEKSGFRILYAPDLLLYELGNSLLFKRLGEDALKAAFHNIADFQIHFERATNILILNSLRLAQVHGLTVYDASYAALAEMIGAELVSADGRLAKLPFGRHLKDV